MDRLIAVALLLALGACSPPAQPAKIVFSGRAPYGALYLETRKVDALCPACSGSVGPGERQCTRTMDGNACGQPLSFPDRVPCGFCGGTKKCDPCSAFETSGRCRYCTGSGRLAGQAPCFNCDRSGACSACAGTGTCDACRGTGEIALPWSRGAPFVPPTPAPAQPRKVQQSLHVAWLGETITWSLTQGEAPSGWVVSIAGKGRRSEVARIPDSKARFTPDKVGSYQAAAGTDLVHFDVIDLGLRETGTHAALISPLPVLKDVNTRWELVLPDGRVRHFQGPSVTVEALGPRRHELWPVLEIRGLPGRRGPKSVVFDGGTPISGDFRIVLAGTGPFPAGQQVEARAAGTTALPPDAKLTWTLTHPAGTSTMEAFGPTAKIPLPRAGTFKLQAASGKVVSNTIEVQVFAAFLADPAERPLLEARISLLDGSIDIGDRVPEQAIRQAPDRIQVMVEDPAPAAERTVTVATRTLENAPLNRAVTLPLTQKGRYWASPPILLLRDRFDDAAPVGDVPDDAAGDLTLLAAAGGKVEVTYRGVTALSAGVEIPTVRSIPLRFHLLGTSRPIGAMQQALDLRLEQANALWEPVGISFRRDSVSAVEFPKNLLVISGRAAGVDEEGKAGRVGFKIGPAEYSVATAWNLLGRPMTPAVTGRALVDKMGAAWKVEIFERLLPDDPDAVLLRIMKPGAAVELLPEAGDLSQILHRPTPDPSGNLSLGVPARMVTLDELGLILGNKGKFADGFDLFIVEGVAGGPDAPSFKAYPGWAFTAAISGSAILSWKIADGAGKYPYALARVLGELLLSPGFRPPEKRSLFADPLSEAAGVGANKRLGPWAREKLGGRGTAAVEK